MINANAFRLPLKDKSMHVCVTSPPYFSLRKYAGEQKFIFGGNPDCAHVWGNELVHKGQTGGVNESSLIYNYGQDGRSEVPESSSNFCQLCNAWYGAYGLEPTLDMYIQHTVEWCREVWRVLRDDGTFWLNIGDSYFGSSNSGGESKIQDGTNKSFRLENMPTKKADGLKPKDLMMVPARVAIALQADGWWIRNDIIWHKTNPMPESATDRCTKSHEYLFLLTKSKDYYYDQDAIREKHQDPADIHRRILKDGQYKHDKSQRGWMTGSKERADQAITRGRNKRTVWTIATKPYSGAHFATYPPALIEPCIKAGTSEHGVCPECGAQWERVTTKASGGTTGKSWHPHEDDLGMGNVKRQSGSEFETYQPGQTIGWQPSCSHYDKMYLTQTARPKKLRKRNQQDLQFSWWWKRIRRRGIPNGWLLNAEFDYLIPVPAKVFDPFLGSGTSIEVARNLGRTGVGTDLSLEYLDLARERLSLKALDEWEQGKDGETDLEGLPMFSNNAHHSPQAR